MINYTDYVDMIKSRANKLSEKYHIPFDELVSEGNLIYCECLNNYDITKASFSTYLYSMLAYGMSDYCRYYNSQVGEGLSDIVSPSDDDSFDENNSILLSYCDDRVTESNLLEDAKSRLSDKAYTILEYILSRKWERKGRVIPCKHTVAKALDTSAYLLTKYWNELAEYWNTEGIALYC